MNCEEIKQKVGIREVLESYGLFPANPAKDNKKTAFYFALDRDERTASLSVNFIKNTAFDFGTGKSYDIISIVQTMNRCSVSDALEYLKKFERSNISKDSAEATENTDYIILKISEVKHPALLQYLQSRKVLEGKDLVKEIHYSIEGKKYFGVGFFNDSGGIEVRNKYSKICLGKKDVTWIKNERRQNTEVAVFEGFFDYLSYRCMEKKIQYAATDYLIFNSTSMLFAAEEILKSYQKLSLFLDNDTAGKVTLQRIVEMNNNVEDCSSLYKDFKDLNKWLCQ